MAMVTQEETKMRRFILAFVATLALSAPAHAGASLVPADQWIGDCIAGLENENGRRIAIEVTGKPSPHEKNVKVCISWWNRFNPDKPVFDASQNAKVAR
jgi:hypothetical protein